MLMAHQRVRKPIFLPDEFVFDIDTAQGDASPTFAIPLVAASTSSNFDVDWGDGSTETITGFGDAALDHTYASGGVYRVKLTTSDLNGWAFSNSGDKDKITSILSWGGFSARNASGHFYGCSNLTIPAVTKDITNGATNLSLMFRGCSGLTELDVSAFDTASAVTFSAMFFGCLGLSTLDVSGFDTGAATDTGSMFRSCSGLTALDVSGFDTSSVTAAGFMFSGCSSLTSLALDQPGWDINQITDLNSICAGVTLDTANYDAILIAWDAQSPLTSGISTSFGNSKYTSGGAADTARANIIATPWTLTDGGAV